MLKRMLFAGAALAFASGAQAATYDAFESFDGVQGTGGFRYLRMDGVNGATLLGSSTNCVVASDFCLQDGAGLPGAYKSLTAIDNPAVTYNVPDDRLLVHPGSSNPIGIFFTATVAGEYDYQAAFDVLDDSPSGVSIIRITNAGGGPAVSTVLGGLGAFNSSLTSTGTVNLAAGQFLAFVVHQGASYSNDSTGVDFTLTTGGGVPEPAAWAMMILGFGGAGAMARRRRATLV